MLGLNTCDEMMVLLSARLDGALTEGEEAQLEEHLAQCGECRALADDLEAIHNAMPGLEEAPPPGLTEAVMARIRATGEEPIPFPVKKSARRHWQTWGTVAAVLAVTVGILGTQRGGLGRVSTAAMPPSAAQSVERGSGAENEMDRIVREGEADSVAPAEEPMPSPGGSAPPQIMMTLPEPLTPEEASQRLCDQLGLDSGTTNGAEGPALKEDTQEQGPSCLQPGGWSVDYQGLSEDGANHEFLVYVGSEEPVRYAVPLDGSDIFVLSAEPF